jgi:hypothetical protein
MGPCLSNSLKDAGLVRVRVRLAGRQGLMRDMPHVYRSEVYGREEMGCDTVRYGTVRYDMTLGPAPCVLRFVRGVCRERREILLRCGVERGVPAPGPAPGSAHLTQATTRPRFCAAAAKVTRWALGLAWGPGVLGG